MQRILVLLVLNSLAGTLTAAPTVDVKELLVTRCVGASLDDTWTAWTTAEGVRSFFSRGSVVDPRVDGEYSILFFPDNPPGSRGAEGMRIIAFEPQHRVMFTWNQPPQLARIRQQRAVVEIRLRDGGDCGTEVQLRHFGWGRGTDWASARAYFAGAWVTVLDRLEWRFDHGPVDWDNLPDTLLYGGPPGVPNERP